MTTGIVNKDGEFVTGYVIQKTSGDCVVIDSMKNCVMKLGCIKSAALTSDSVVSWGGENGSSALLVKFRVKTRRCR